MTSFVLLSLLAMGRARHPVAERGLEFLIAPAMGGVAPSRVLLATELSWMPTWVLMPVSAFLELDVFVTYVPRPIQIATHKHDTFEERALVSLRSAGDGTHFGRKNGRMPGMPTPRVKISVSLPRDLVARIDSAARSQARSRSSVLEGWLRGSAKERASRELEAATIAYYESLTPEDRHEDEAMAAASSRATRHVRIDDAPAAGPQRRRRS